MSASDEAKIADLPIANRLKKAILDYISRWDHLSKPLDTVAALKEFIRFDDSHLGGLYRIERIPGVGRKSVETVWRALSDEPIPKSPYQIARERNKTERKAIIPKPTREQKRLMRERAEYERLKAKFDATPPAQGNESAPK